MQFQCQAIALFAKRDLSGNTRLKSDLRISRRNPFLERLRCVVSDVDDGLNQLLMSPRKSGIEMS